MSARTAREVLQAVRLPMEIVDGDDGRKVVLYGEIGPKGIDAILSALRSAGWAVVPVELTDKMIFEALGFRDIEGRADRSLQEFWRLLLKAAQEDSRE